VSRPQSTYAATQNMRLALQTIYTARDAGPGAPRLCIFYGNSGYGKTVAAAHAAALTDAVYLLARSVWTPKSFLEAMCREIGIVRPAKTAADMMDQIIARLNQCPQPIILDEMDHLVTKKSVEMIRDIYEATQVPIMMIGEEALPARLKEWERFDNRLIAVTRAEPSSFDDGRLLRDVYTRGVRVDNDLADHFTRECRGIARRIVVNLSQAHRVAIDELGTEAIDLKAWGDRPVLTGDLPVRPRPLVY
jgi:hypothetical protein